MKKYRKFKKKKTLNPYVIFILVVVCILAMSVGYAISTDTLTIKGTATAKYKVYVITYELNGGKNPDNAITEFTIKDADIPLPIPTKTGFAFVGWYDNSDCTGKTMKTTEGFEDDITLYAKWKKGVESEVAFNEPGIHHFDGTNYITTDVYLYTNENVNKNFMMSFNIVSVSKDNVNNNALANSMDERANPWPGHVVKYYSKDGKKCVKFESNSNTSGEGNLDLPDSVSNIRIFRINNYMYVSLDGNRLIKVNDYNGFTDTFEIPVTFGASIDEKGKPYRYFKGDLSDLYVAFLSDNATVDDFNPQKPTMKILYQHEGQYAFDGESDYIDTGLKLFNSDNVSKDFEITFNIDSVGDGFVNQATIVNCKNEKITSYPGFVYRLYSGDKKVKFEAKAGTGNGCTNKISEVKKVRISRIDSIMYVSINDGEQKKVYDYSNFSNYFDVPITIGASLDKNGNPFRFFKGVLSDIVIKVDEQ